VLTQCSRGKEEALKKEINENVQANLINNIFVVNAFLDLVRHGKEKKIIFISSPSGDIEFNRVTGVTNMLGYSVSKAGMNIVTTKFGAELAQEGIKTLSLSPGWVDTDAGQSPPQRESCQAQITDSGNSSNNHRRPGYTETHSQCVS
jgi:NAD(P)-dependent dehydrogenase (short-subunit alcohol dehydrogenase family)